MQRWESMVAHTVVCLLAAGCAAEGVEPEWPEQGAIAGAASPEIDVTAQALDSTWAKRYTVSGNQSVAMDSNSTHVCVLTRVAGSFQGWGESVRVERNSVQHILTSKSMQPGVSAEAHCFALSKFISDDNSRVSAYFNGSAWSTCWSNGCREKTDNFFNWRLSTFVNGIGGKWDGSCEFVRIPQVFSGYTPVTIASGTSCDVPTQAWFDAFSIGSGNRPAKYFTNGSSQTFTANSLNSSRRKVLAPTSDAMCHFTEIGGDFNGAGEFAQIRPEIVQPGIEKWVLTVGHGSGSGVWASARCYMRSQL